MAAEGGGNPAGHPNRQPMLLLVPVLLVWLLIALATIALCAYAGQADDEMDPAELAPVIEIRSAA